MFWSLFLTKKLRSYSPGVTDQSKTQGATCPPQIQEIQRNDGPEKRWCLRNRDDQEKGQEGVVDVIRSYILHNRYIYINTWCITMYTPKLFLSKWLLSSHLRIIDPNSPPKKKTSHLQRKKCPNQWTNVPIFSSSFKLMKQKHTLVCLRSMNPRKKAHHLANDTVVGTYSGLSLRKGF